MGYINTDKEKIEVLFVDDETRLFELVKVLKAKKVISFDTEFDRFWREYGFKLFLLQIFDGETCYLVDPLALKNLQPLWAIFENEEICKVAYACSEDIQILKINNCFPKNIFDVQVAAKICNHSANSYSDLINSVFNVPVDKSMQRSNWRIRPLPNAQQIYAANDVVWLIKLYVMFSLTIKETGVEEIMEEENKYCETLEVNEYTVKLTPKQKYKYNSQQQDNLFELMNVRNVIAQQYNMPPANICSDTTLEEIVDDKIKFLDSAFTKGFTKRMMEDEKSQDLFLQSINAITYKKYVEDKTKNSGDYFSNKLVLRGEEKDEMLEKISKISKAVQKQYGENAGDFIMRGLKKGLLELPFSKIKLRDYQFKIINKTCAELEISL